MPLPRYRPRSGFGRAVFGEAMIVADKIKSKKVGGEREQAIARAHAEPPHQQLAALLVRRNGWCDIDKGGH